MMCWGFMLGMKRSKFISEVLPQPTGPERRMPFVRLMPDSAAMVVSCRK